MTLLGSRGWDLRKEFEAKKYLYDEGIRMEAPQTQSGRLKGTANVSYGKASIDVTGLKESAGTPRNLLLVYSLTPAQFLPVPFRGEVDDEGPSLECMEKGPPSSLSPSSKCLSFSICAPNSPHSKWACLCPGVGKVGCESPRACLLGSQLTWPKGTL